MRFVVVGAGAIGGTVGARLVRDGHDVLFCDIDADHVAAMNDGGLSIEGPVEELTVTASAVLPEDLPNGLEHVLLAVKSQHTASALGAIAPRLAPGGYVVSLQNGLNEPLIAAAVGTERTVGAFVNFGADYAGPGRIFLGGRGTFVIGELDGRRSDRVGVLVGAIEDARETHNVLGFLWGKMAYGAMLFGTAVSELSIADALAEPAYRPLFVHLAQEALDSATARPEAFDGFDPADLDGSLERLVEFNRRSAKTHSGIYRDLAVRRRPTEVAMLDPIERPRVRRTAELIHAIEDGRRVCERANLELLAAYDRLEEWAPKLNAVTAVIGAPDRAPAGPLHGCAVAVKDNMDVAGYVTTNASTVGTPPPAARDAEVVARLRAAGADVFCKTNLLEYGAGSVSPAYGMTYNPLNLGRTSGGSSSGSAALVAAGVCDYALGTDTGGSIRIPAAYCGLVGLKPTFGLVPTDGVFPLCPGLENVGPITRTVEQAARLLEVVTGRPYALGSVAGLRVGVLRRQLDDPDLRPLVRDRVSEAAATLSELGLELVEVDIPELELVDEALGPIILRDAFEIHRRWLETEADGYGPGTRALLELGSAVTDEQYRQAQAARERVSAGFERVLRDVDVLLGPSAAFVAPPEDPPFGTPEGDVEGRFSGPCNVAGIPAVTVPCGLAEDGLPAGLQLAAGPHREALLLSVARAYEEARGVRVHDCNWMQIERYLEGDDRIVLPLGSTEQHGYLSLGVDAILAERVAVEAAEPLGVPVLPALPFGLTPYFGAYPGSPTFRVDTYVAVVRDLLDSLYGQGFRRFLLVNGHGGNSPAGAFAIEWTAANAGAQVRFHNWWNGPRTWAVVQSIDPDAGHASWLENFPWTRLAGVVLPEGKKPMADLRTLAVCDPAGVRDLLGDGSYGGVYQRSDDEMLAVWQAGIEEVRELLADGWRDG